VSGENSEGGGFSASAVTCLEAASLGLRCPELAVHPLLLLPHQPLFVWPREKDSFRQPRWRVMARPGGRPDFSLEDVIGTQDPKEALHRSPKHAGRQLLQYDNNGCRPLWTSPRRWNTLGKVILKRLRAQASAPQIPSDLWDHALTGHASPPCGARPADPFMWVCCYLPLW